MSGKAIALRVLGGAVVCLAGLMTARIAYQAGIAPVPQLTQSKSDLARTTPAQADLSGFNNTSDESATRVASSGIVPEEQERARSSRGADEDDPLLSLHLLRKTLSEIHSLEDFKRSDIPKRLDACFTSKHFFEAADILFELAKTKQPWALEYLSEVAQSSSLGDQKQGSEENQEQMKKWERRIREATVAALISVDTPESQGLVKSLFNGSLTGQTALSPWDVLDTAAEANTAFSKNLYLEAFRGASVEDRLRCLNEAIPYNQALANDDVRLQVLRESLSQQENPELSSQAARILLDSRHNQYYGGAERATSLLEDTFFSLSPDGQVGLLGEVETYLNDPGTVASGAEGNVQAMDALLSAGMTSEDQSVRHAAEEIEQRIAATVNSDELAREASENVLWLRELCGSLH